MAENRELALVLRLVADQFQSELKKSGGVLGEFNKFISDWKVQLPAAGTALFAVAKSTANFGEEALESSQRLGMTVQATTALQHAAHMADVPMATLEQGLKTLAQNAVEAAQGTGEGAKLFSALGLSATNATGKIKPLDQLLFEFQDRLKGVSNQAEFVDAGVQSFGKSFMDMVPFIKQGSAATKEAMEEGRRFGVAMTKEQAEAASRFNDELKKLHAQLTGIKLSVGNELIPVISDLIELFRTIGVGTGLSGGLRILHEQFIRLNVLLKELQANSQFLFGTGKDKLTFDMLKERIDAIEGDAKKKLFEFRHPGVLTPEKPTPVPGAGSGGGLNPGPGGVGRPAFADAHVEDFKKHFKEHWSLVFAGAEGMRQEVNAEVDRLIEDLKADNQRTIDQITKDFAGDTSEERQVAAGRRIVEQTQKDLAAQERDQLVQNLQAWVQYDDQVGASSELRYAHQLDLVRANLAQQTQLTTAESARLLLAWQNHDEELAQQILARTTLTAQQKETIELQTLARTAQANARAADDVFAGWAKGMQDYVRDTESGFGLGADMARRTAQAMEQSFRTFFFDLFEGRVKSLKDVLKGVLDFVKQIASQIAAQLAVKGTLTAFGLNANSGGLVVQRFAAGGPVLGTGNRDTVPALLTPGEFVLSRQDVGAILRGVTSPQGGGPITVNVVNPGREEKPAVNVRRELEGTVIDIIFRDVQRNGPLRRLMQGA